MKIYVCSAKDMRSQWYTDKSWYNSKKHFITICGMIEGGYAYPYTGSNVLRCYFDDVTEAESDNPAVMLFSEDEAEKIHHFADSIKHMDEYPLYVNCNAGISRSGAVGYCLNEYFNRDKSEDYKQFYLDNRQIQPNPMVKRILMKELFGTPDWNEIFKEKK